MDNLKANLPCEYAKGKAFLFVSIHICSKINEGIWIEDLTQRDTLAGFDNFQAYKVLERTKDL